MSFVRFGMIVTGVGESQFLPKVFRAICSGAYCSFEVIRRSGQLRPITSPSRKLKMVGRGQVIPTIDEEQYGLPAYGFLRANPDAYVLVIDDLEADPNPEGVFARYRAALDAVIARQNLSHRAAVFFLVNMLEAYYFGHAGVVNGVAGYSILTGDHSDDVEQIRHPKNVLKALWPQFDNVKHGEAIVSALDLDHVLVNPQYCRWLRSLVAWCISRLKESDSIWDGQLRNRFRLVDGQQAQLTMTQGNAHS